MENYEKTLANFRATAIVAEKMKRYYELEAEIESYKEAIVKMENSLNKIIEQLNQERDNSAEINDQLNISREIQIITGVFEDLIASTVEAKEKLTKIQQELTSEKKEKAK